MVSPLNVGFIKGHNLFSTLLPDVAVLLVNDCITVDLFLTCFVRL